MTFPNSDVFLRIRERELANRSGHPLIVSPLSATGGFLFATRKGVKSLLDRAPTFRYLCTASDIGRLLWCGFLAPVKSRQPKINLLSVANSVLAIEQV